MKQTVQVNIQGQEFSLRTDLPTAQVEAVADFVNAQIDAISGADRSVDTYRAVVLALLNVAGLYLHQEQAPASPDTSGGNADLDQRLKLLVGRMEDALKDPQGTLDF
ncbi:MAG: hypothetical protein C0624_12515 [Desulfuromonas sp.]|nr:MAG: hypothetical protein C0624_12515 [Desulfuromonas sp.]